MVRRMELNIRAARPGRCTDMVLPFIPCNALVVIGFDLIIDSESRCDRLPWFIVSEFSMVP